MMDIGKSSCEDIWEQSVKEIEQCLERESLEVCHKKLHENPAMRGIYKPQLEVWRQHFDRDQFFVLQSDAMFKNLNATMQSVVEFLRIRPYTEAELASFTTAYTGSAHHSDPLINECGHLTEAMKAFYDRFTGGLREFLVREFPNTLLQPSAPTNWLR